MGVTNRIIKGVKKIQKRVSRFLIENAKKLFYVLIILVSIAGIVLFSIYYYFNIYLNQILMMGHLILYSVIQTNM